MKKAVAIMMCGILSIGALGGCGLKLPISSDDEIGKLEKKINRLEKELSELEDENLQLMAELDKAKAELAEYQNDGWVDDWGENWDWVDLESPIYRDENGNPYDLGGIEIVVRDWWWSDENFEHPMTDYEIELYDYIHWCEDTYNFTFKRKAMSAWNTVPDDFVDYVSSGGDDNNYIFVLSDGPKVSQAVWDRLAYDLTKLDCLYFYEYKFQKNMGYYTYANKSSIYSMPSETLDPGIGVFFNKSILRDKELGYEDIYDMQEKGEWTWENFEAIMRVIQHDEDGDGKPDAYALTTNMPFMTEASVFSNGGEFIGLNRRGFTNEIMSDETVEALTWVNSMYDKYMIPDELLADGAYYYDSFNNGEVCFLVDYGTIGGPYGLLNDDIDYGFVSFPKGPSSTNKEYYTCHSIAPVMIPSCYDEDRAWKIAFAWSVISDGPIDYTGFDEKRDSYAGCFDDKACNETLERMRHPDALVQDHSVMVPGIDIYADVLWEIDGSTDIPALLMNLVNKWDSLVEAANR